MYTTFADGQKQTDAVVEPSFTLWANWLRNLAAESTAYSKKSIEASSAFIEQLVTAPTLDTALQLQTQYSSTICENLIARANKLGEIYINLATDFWVSKPMEPPIVSMAVDARLPLERANKSDERPEIEMAPPETAFCTPQSTNATASAEAPWRSFQALTKQTKRAVKQTDKGLTDAIQAAAARTLANVSALPDDFVKHS